MQTATTLEATTSRKQPNREAIRIIAKSLFRELIESGYDGPEIVTFSSELLSLVARDVRTAASNDDLS